MNRLLRTLPLIALLAAGQTALAQDSSETEEPAEDTAAQALDMGQEI